MSPHAVPFLRPLSDSLADPLIEPLIEPLVEPVLEPLLQPLVPLLQWLDAWQPFVIALLSLLAVVVAGGHAVMWKRDPRAALGWLGLILVLPVIGAALYAVFGINRLSRKAQALYSRHDRHPAKIRGRGEGGEGGEGGEEADQAASAEEALATLGLAELDALVSRTVRPEARQLFGGNLVEPLATGAEAYDAMLQAIDEAEQSVTLLTYIFDNDPAGRRFLEALRRAEERGVEVRVLIDALGDRYTFPSMRGRLEKAGLRAAVFLPTLWPTHMVYANLRNHRKLLVADGRLAFTGGMNIRQGHVAQPGDDDRYDPIVDLHFRVEGPVVASLQGVFCDDWAFTTGEQLHTDAFFPELEPVGGVLARALEDGPGRSLSRLRWVKLGALACAHERVRIATPYFLPDEGLLTGLVTAARRGVDVEVLIPEKNNLLLVQWACDAMLWQLLDGGVTVRKVAPPFDHSKLMLVDDAWSLLGSANWDARSLRLNFELDMECYDRELAQRLSDLLDEKVARSRQVTLDEMDGRSVPIRLRDGLARLATPYL